MKQSRGILRMTVRHRTFGIQLALLAISCYQLIPFISHTLKIRLYEE